MAEERRLAAIVVGDIVGYSAMIGRNEPDTLAKVFAFQTQVLEPAVGDHAGRIVKTTGDGFLAEFSSVIKAVEASVAMQEALASWPDVGDPLSLRIGIHLGDIAVRDGDIFGDGVNIAARLEQRADPGGVLVSAAVHEQLRGHPVGPFVDAGPLDLKNISRPIVAWRWSPDRALPPRPARRPAAKPSIAVMPFDNLSGDPEQEYLADGVVQDLITNLSRFHWFKVIARTSTFAVERKGLSVTELGVKLGAAYLLLGSVRRSGERVRVTAELIDASIGTQLWADRIDVRLDDIFELQDAIVQRIVGTVVPEFVAAVGAGFPSEHRTSQSSWDLAMRGWNLVWRLDGSEASMLEAREHFGRAIEADPDNAVAHSGLAFSYGNPFYLAGLERDIDRALEEAHRAAELDPRNAFAWCLVGAAHMWSGNLDEAERQVKRAIAINPSLALAHIYLASICCWRADVDGADAWTASAQELSPADPMLPFAHFSRAMALFATADYVGALRICDQVIDAAPELPSIWRIRAACLESMGDHAGARAAIDRMEALAPITMAWARENLTPFTDRERWGAYLSALEAAGVPPG